MPELCATQVLSYLHPSERKPNSDALTHILQKATINTQCILYTWVSRKEEFYFLLWSKSV